ncbi:MAG: hypothetical protein SFY66_19820 [Oculatellaceae cyanobacterium bins.114]|nr:hypothetical protein [Oculatellaceae cyanobacterium bins.114]
MSDADAAVLTLKDGRTIEQIDEEELDGDLYFRFQRESVKHKNAPDEAMKWLMMRLFTVGGEPLTIDHLTEKPSQGGLGFRAVASLGNLAGEFIQGLPNPKTQSSSVSSQAGDSES